MTYAFDPLAYLTGGLISNPNISVTTHVVGEGTITKDPDKQWYNGEEVTFTAIPGPGYAFSHWEFDGTGTNPVITLTANHDLAVLAIFVSPRTIQISIEGGGTVVTDPVGIDNIYPENIAVRLTATPLDASWIFAGWTGIDDAEEAIEPEITIYTYRSYQIVATFISVESTALTIVVSGEGYTDPAPGVHPYEPGSRVLIKAISNDDWIFSHWLHEDLRVYNKTKVILLEENQVWFAYFNRLIRLNIIADGDGRINPAVGTYNYTEPLYLTLEATPNSIGWEFDHWVYDTTSYENPIKIFVRESKDITAVFRVKEQKLVCSVQGYGSITPFGTNYYPLNTIVPIEAIPDPGWHFAYWLGNLIDAENPTQITMIKDLSVLAVFEQD